MCTVRIKAAVLATAWLALCMAVPLFGQVPSALRSTTAQSSASAGRFGADIDNYMGTRSWSGITFDRHFFFLGGRYQGTVTPSIGYAIRFGEYYLGLYFRGTVVQGDNTHHNGTWDSEWDTDGNGSSGFTLDDTAAVLFGVPGIGGFRFDWIASDASGAANPRFERFKGVTRSYNGQTVDYAQGTSSGSMAFLLSYGGLFIGNLKADATVGYATSESVNVTGGQIGPHIFKFNQTQNSKIYLKLGLGYNLNDTSSVDGDYSLILMPGRQWEQTIGYAGTSLKAEGNFQHIINLNYSKTFNFDDKISMKLKPNLNFDILSEKDIYETESGKVDNGRQTTVKIIPSIAVGLQYKAAPKLSLYTGTTIQLFDYAIKDGEKGADGINAAYFNGSRSDIIQGTESGFDIGASLALTDTLSLDFNARTLINSVFVSSSPMVDLYLTFKPGVKTPPPTVTSGAPAAEEPSPTAAASGAPAAVTAEPAPAPADAAAPVIIAQPQSASYAQYADAAALSVTAVSGDGGSLSYRWFVNTRNSNTGGTMITWATSATFTPPTSIPGTVYYYVIVTNTNDSASDVKTSSVTSGTAAITITAQDN